MGRLFGTDGVRGLANRDLTAELALRPRRRGRTTCSADTGAFEGHRPTAVVGRDPRASGEMLEAAVIAGLTSAGVDARASVCCPTPAVAYLTDAYDADFGVMISASHNPMPDNGIKIFVARRAQARRRHRGPHRSSWLREPWDRPTGAVIGRVVDADDAVERYQRHVARPPPPHRLDGLTVVVDCANGAASTAAPRAYADAGANVIAIHADPDGLNINDDCGSTHMDDARRQPCLTTAPILGLAHDGDADRCLAVDATGALVDGDTIMAILAGAMNAAGELAGSTLVATVMSNLGLHLAMDVAGITVAHHRCRRSLRSGGHARRRLLLGGEQSPGTS